MSEHVKARRSQQKNELELVLGAGGVQGPVHIGVLRCLEERQLPIGMVSGASAGALIAAFVANGYDSKELKKIFLSEEFRYPSWDLWSKCQRPFGFPLLPMGLDKSAWMNFWLDMCWPWVIDFRPWIEHTVKKYGLKPQENLRLVAAEWPLTRRPVIFEGRDYDLVEALTASTAAISGLGMRPFWYNAAASHEHKDKDDCQSDHGHLLIDGFYYHPIPAALCQKKPAIVSKIGFATRLPSERLSPPDLFMHMREMYLAQFFARSFPDPEGHIIIEAGLSNVATTNFDVSARTLEQMVAHGYQSACSRLDDADCRELGI